MSHDANGSKPGHILDHDDLSRVNTFPIAEFTIPPPDTLSQCRSVPTHSAESPVSQGRAEKAKNVTTLGDEEKQSVVSHQNDEVSYPEGGLTAWLVVVGSFLGLLAVLLA